MSKQTLAATTLAVGATAGMGSVASKPRITRWYSRLRKPAMFRPTGCSRSPGPRCTPISRSPPRRQSTGCAPRDARMRPAATRRAGRQPDPQRRLELAVLQVQQARRLCGGCTGCWQPAAPISLGGPRRPTRVPVPRCCRIRSGVPLPLQCRSTSGYSTADESGPADARAVVVSSRSPTARPAAAAAGGRRQRRRARVFRAGPAPGGVVRGSADAVPVRFAATAARRPGRAAAGDTRKARGAHSRHRQ